jgi:5-(carboxyamino)imidazole ribonucleotide synthase
MVIEGVIDFEKEISVIVARGVDGVMATFPACENLHENHILDVTIVPARVSPKVETDAAELARTIAEKIELVGLLAVEMFLTKNGDLVVNELAPRQHNSGHWTIEGAATSQFENHLRAILDRPLGDTTARGHAAMINLIGSMPDRPEALADAGFRLHDYEKAPRPGRKLGHLTTVAGSPAERDRALSAALQLLGQ